MPTQVKASISYSEKAGTANYGSIGASCGMEIEFSAEELATLQDQVARGFQECREAVKAEIARQMEPEPQAPVKTKEQVRQEAYDACKSADAMKETLMKWSQQRPVGEYLELWEQLFEEARTYARGKIQSGEWTDYDGLTEVIKGIEKQIAFCKEGGARF